MLIENSNIETKILVIQKGEDNTSEYNSFMNCIFSAQKCAIPVDAVVLNAKQSSFMQQACYLTEGIYLRPDYQSDILQLLITHCLPTITSRKLLKAPLMVYIYCAVLFIYLYELCRLLCYHFRSILYV